MARGHRADPVAAYAKSVLAGRIVAGPHVRNACARHLRDLKEGPKRGLKWDLKAAQFVLGFFPDVLRLAGGQFEGLPFTLEPSQAFIVGSLFGWKRTDGTRRFRRAFIEEGKGNGKTPLAAGIGLFGLIADGEARAEIYAAASDRDQAMVLFRDAVAMVDQSPRLSEIIKQSGENPVYNLADFETGSFFRPISREKRRQGSGPRPHFALCDEVHEHPDRYIVDMLERGFKWRRQPLLLMITNSGADRNSICWEEHEHGVKVAAGEIEDDETFAYVCALDEGDDPLEDPSCWPKVNPLLGVTVTEDYLAGVVRQAKAIPGKLNLTLRLHFCVWTDAEEAWLPAATWASCEDEAMRLDEFAGEPCTVALDLSEVKDLTAMTIVFRDGEKEVTREDGETKVLPKLAAFVEFWTPGDTIHERSLADKAPYDVWAAQGFLHAPPGPLIRHDHVAHRLYELSQEFVIEAVVYDRYLIKKFSDELDVMGLDLPLVEHPQGWQQRQSTELWMPQSINETEAAILEQRLRVAVNPVLRWNVASAKFITSPAGLRRFTKQRATGRIDGAVALAMGVGAMAHAAPVPVSPWEDPDYRMAVI